MLNDMGFLWAVTAVVWLVTLGYVISLLRRQNQLQRELESLEQQLSDLGR
ncbi:MAG: CcmD family protein [Alicyclobacillus sp.]|nr:CcmD family protein [Alicyclobacillus sp.]